MALSDASRRMLNSLKVNDTVAVTVTLRCSELYAGSGKTFNVGCNSFSVNTLTDYADSVSVVSRRGDFHPLDEAAPGEVWEAFHRDVRMVFLVHHTDDLLVRLTPRPETLDRAWWRTHAKRWRRITDEDLELV